MPKEFPVTWKHAEWGVQQSQRRMVTLWKDLEKRSTVVNITIFPWEGGSPVTKSTAIWDQGWCGVGGGRRTEKTSWRLMRSLTSGAGGAGGNKRTGILWNCWPPKVFLKEGEILLMPGWQVHLDEWSLFRTWEKTETGTKSRLGDQCQNRPRNRARQVWRELSLRVWWRKGFYGPFKQGKVIVLPLDSASIPAVPELLTKVLGFRKRIKVELL